MNEQLTVPAGTLDLAAVTRIADAVMRSRKTVRAYRSDPVPRQTVVDILDVARSAPSNSNSQPWRVYALAGQRKASFSDALIASHASGSVPPYAHFPDELPEACKQRQDDFGERYYRALGIERGDSLARGRQTARNFQFFGAPVGLIFTIDACYTKHSWLDYGLFIQNVMIAARARGLATCPQVVFVRYQRVIAENLKLPQGQNVVCGMSLGYPNERAKVNQLGMPREPVELFASLLGFDEESPSSPD
jgi:nitroreductase